mgnify:CR=1 FL=1
MDEVPKVVAILHETIVGLSWVTPLGHALLCVEFFGDRCGWSGIYDFFSLGLFLSCIVNTMCIKASLAAITFGFILL